MRPSSDLYARTPPPSTVRKLAAIVSFASLLAWKSVVSTQLVSAEPPPKADGATTEHSIPATAPDSGRPAATMDAARPSAGAEAPNAPHVPLAARWHGVQVVVYKAKRLLAVYRDGNFDREFRIVLGLVPEGRKRHADDARTPEGLYRVSGKRPHGKWQHFLALDYPNARDRERYEADVKRGAIPDDAGRPFGIGGDIGIHGNDRAEEQANGKDWTKGCIALSAVDIAELNGIVPVGTPVWIVE